MAVAIYGVIDEGVPQHILNIDQLMPNLPTLADGAGLQASVLDLPAGAKLVAIVVPAAAGPSAPAVATPPAGT